MKILELSPTRLKLKHRPIRNWYVGVLVGLMGFVTFGYSTLFATASARLNCDRPTPNLTPINCTLRRTTLVGTAQTLRLFDPYAAQVVTHQGSRGSRSYTVVVSTPTVHVSLMSQGSGSYRSNQAIAQHIQTFLASRQRSLAVHQAAYDFLLLLGVAGLGIGGMGIFWATSPVTTCTFYKAIHKVVIERRGLRGLQVIERPLDQISQVEIEDRRERSGKVHRIVLILKSQERLPANREYTDLRSVQAAIYSIKTFLDLR